MPEVGAKVLVHEAPSGSLIALESAVGWLIQGTESAMNVIVDAEPTEIRALHVRLGETQTLSDQLRSFWEMESIGVE